MTVILQSTTILNACRRDGFIISCLLCNRVSGYIRRTKAGVPTNAIYGFLRYMWDAIDKFQPTHVACRWDMGSKHFEQSSSRRIKAIVRSPG